MLLREHYITPLITSNPNPPGSAWVISGWYTKGGTFAFGDHSNGVVSALTRLCGGAGERVRHVGGGVVHVLNGRQCLAQHGYTHWTSYQPASRFWPFQWIEGGWLLALSIVLLAATIWLVRRPAI